MTDAMMESVGVQVQGHVVETMWSLARETKVDNAGMPQGVCGSAPLRTPRVMGPSTDIHGKRVRRGKTPVPPTPL